MPRLKTARKRTSKCHLLLFCSASFPKWCKVNCQICVLIWLRALPLEPFHLSYFEKEGSWGGGGGGGGGGGSEELKG